MNAQEAEAIVKAKYPEAKIHWSAYNVTVQVGQDVIGWKRRPLYADDTGTTEYYESNAWKDAARRIGLQGEGRDEPVNSRLR